MANRKFQSSTPQQARNEFINIDLLPDVKRPRQFNVNLILVVLIGVVFTWLIIYLPLTGRQSRLDAALETNNELQYQLILVNEEISGYNIEQHRIDYANQIETLETLGIDFDRYMETLMPAILNNNTDITFVQFDADTMRFTFRVRSSNQINFMFIEDTLYEHDDIVDSIQRGAISDDGTGMFVTEFVIGVKRDA